MDRLMDRLSWTGTNSPNQYQLLAQRLETASGFWGAGSYSFDSLGNIRTKTESGIALDYSYSAGTNRLAGIDDSVGSADYAFSYDGYGNVTNNGHTIMDRHK